MSVNRISDHDGAVQRIRDLSNSGRYKQAYALALRLHRQYPNNIEFAYLEAVFYSEDTRFLSVKEKQRRYAHTAKKLKKLLIRIRGVREPLRHSIRNEYYWFSCQPDKQFRLGVELVKKGVKHAHYCQGVGAAQMALRYAQNRRAKLI